MLTGTCLSYFQGSSPIEANRSPVAPSPCRTLVFFLFSHSASRHISLMLHWFGSLFKFFLPWQAFCRLFFVLAVVFTNHGEALDGHNMYPMFSGKTGCGVAQLKQHEYLHGTCTMQNLVSVGE